MTRAILCLTLAGFLPGCALFPLTEADCRPECGRMGIAVAEDEYLAGWKDGYDEYHRLMGSFKKRSH